jgi:5'-3' exonuclease
MSLESLRERFAELAKTMNDDSTLDSRVMLVDGMNTYLRAFAASQDMNENGEHIGGITGFLKSVALASRQFKPSRLVIVFDGKGGSLKRRELFPDYKNKRRNMTQLNRTYDFKSLENEKAAIKWQLITLISILKTLPVTVISQEYVEADDVIAYIAQTVEMRGGNSVIVSTDKDFLQLVNEQTVVYNPVKKKRYDTQLVVEDYGFHPTNFLLYRMVAGDDSDCIPGVKGVKEKTLLKYFPELAEGEPKDLEHIISRATEIAAATKKPPVAIQALIECRQTLELNSKLMRLDKAAMSGGTTSSVLTQFDTPPGTLRKKDFHLYMAGIHRTNIVTDVDQWLNSSFAHLMRFKIK